jgi:hypothetical protein
MLTKAAQKKIKIDHKNTGLVIMESTTNNISNGKSTCSSPVQ